MVYMVILYKRQGIFKKVSCKAQFQGSRKRGRAEEEMCRQHPLTGPPESYAETPVISTWLDGDGELESWCVCPHSAGNHAHSRSREPVTVNSDQGDVRL